MIKTDLKVHGFFIFYLFCLPQEIYESTVPHDPEGLLGTLMSCLICFLGLQVSSLSLNAESFENF